MTTLNTLKGLKTILVRRGTINRRYLMQNRPTPNTKGRRQTLRPTTILIYHFRVRIAKNIRLKPNFGRYRIQTTKIGPRVRHVFTLIRTDKRTRNNTRHFVKGLGPSINTFLLCGIDCLTRGVDERRKLIVLVGRRQRQGARNTLTTSTPIKTDLCHTRSSITTPNQRPTNLIGFYRHRQAGLLRTSRRLLSNTRSGQHFKTPTIQMLINRLLTTRRRTINYRRFGSHFVTLGCILTRGDQRTTFYHMVTIVVCQEGRQRPMLRARIMIVYAITKNGIRNA